MIKSVRILYKMPSSSLRFLSQPLFGDFPLAKNNRSQVEPEDRDGNLRLHRLPLQGETPLKAGSHPMERWKGRLRIRTLRNPELMALMIRSFGGQSDRLLGRPLFTLEATA